MIPSIGAAIRAHRGINDCVLTGSVDGALDNYTSNTSLDSLDVVVEAILAKADRQLPWAIGVQLVEDVKRQLQKELASNAFDSKAVAFECLAKAVIAASPHATRAASM